MTEDPQVEDSVVAKEQKRVQALEKLGQYFGGIEIFQLFEFLAQLERQGKTASNRLIDVEYEGRNANEIIAQVLGGDLNVLPLPRGTFYPDFQWLVFYHNAEERHKLISELGYDEYKKRYPTNGGSDIRVFKREEGNGVLAFSSNRDGQSFDEEIVSLWDAACGKMELPVRVEDRVHGVVYTNPKYQEEAALR